MSLRSRRAAAPVSSSASTTILPLTMWSPPANRSIVDTSALRQQVLVMVVFAISAFTCAVMAMRPILPCESTTLRARLPPAKRWQPSAMTVWRLAASRTPVRRSEAAQDLAVRRRQLLRIVPRGPVVQRDVGEPELRTALAGQALELGQVGDLARVEEDGPDGQV